MKVLFQVHLHATEQTLEKLSTIEEAPQTLKWALDLMLKALDQPLVKDKTVIDMYPLSITVVPDDYALTGMDHDAAIGRLIDALLNTPRGQEGVYKIDDFEAFEGPIDL